MLGFNTELHNFAYEQIRSEKLIITSMTSWL